MLKKFILSIEPCVEHPLTGQNTQQITLQLYFSDVLRVASLYKFGGTYIDTDVITLAKHPDVKNYLNFEEPGNKITKNIRELIEIQ